MIGAVDLTYSRYHQGTESPLIPREQADAGKTERKPLWPAEPPDGDREMAEITERLNRRAAHLEGGVRFHIERPAKRPPQIVMSAGPEDTVLGRYQAADIIDLERSLFDMAGFRFSMMG